LKGHYSKTNRLRDKDLLSSHSHITSCNVLEADAVFAVHVKKPGTQTAQSKSLYLLILLA